MIHVHAEVARNISSVADVIHNRQKIQARIENSVRACTEFRIINKGGERNGRTRPDETRVTNI